MIVPCPQRAERPVAPAPEGAGRPSRYCETAGHNAQSAFRERRRRAAGELDGSDVGEQRGGERPVSLAGATLRDPWAMLLAEDFQAQMASHTTANPDRDLAGRGSKVVSLVPPVGFEPTLSEV